MAAPPEVFITTTDEVQKCPGRAEVTEWPEPWNPSHAASGGVVVGIHYWDQVLANPVTTRTRLLSLRTPRFRILPTENPPGMYPSLTVELLDRT